MVFLLDSMESENERYVGQRGPDKESREFNPKSLSNLKQFQKPIQNVNPSINLAVNSGTNRNKLGMITIFVIIVGLLIWKIRQKKKAL